MSHAHRPVIVSAAIPGSSFRFSEIFEIIGKREHKILLQNLALRIGDLGTGYGTVDALILFQEVKYR